MNSDRDLLDLFVDGTPLSPETIGQLIEKGLLKRDNIAPFGQRGVWLTDTGKSLLKPLPPGDSASCPDEGACQPESLKVQVGGDHYKNFAIQPVEFIEKNGLPFLEGCIIKRVCRHGAKAKAEDLRKAIHELRLLIELRYGEKP